MKEEFCLVTDNVHEFIDYYTNYSETLVEEMKKIVTCLMNIDKKIPKKLSKCKWKINRIVQIKEI